VSQLRSRSKKYDIVIVGAGPAGIFASLELISKKNHQKIALIDMGDSIEKRKKKDVMSGFGGAGTYSDGKLHYSPELSHERTLHLITKKKYQKILDGIETTFKKFGVNSPIYPADLSTIGKMKTEAERNNIELIIRRTQHAGTDKLKTVISKIQKHLIDQKIELIFNTKIKDLLIEKGQCKGVVDSRGTKYYAKKVLLAPGRVSAKWLQGIAKKYGMKFHYGMVEVGVRVEFPESVMKTYANTLYEVLLKVRTPTYDDTMRTFCACPNGYVSVETYRDYVCVNGHSNSSHLSPNSNFAFVCEVHLTEPVENSIAYAESIAKLASTIGGGKPILQRLTDLRKNRRSTQSRLKKSIVQPSLKNITPGDISMALPHRLVTNILEGLVILDKVMPGVNSGSTLLYAPEVKFRSSMITTDKKMQTTLNNVHVAGDASGLSGSITGAAATGIMATRGMLK